MWDVVDRNVSLRDSLMLVVEVKQIILFLRDLASLSFAYCVQAVLPLVHKLLQELSVYFYTLVRLSLLIFHADADRFGKTRHLC